MEKYTFSKEICYSKRLKTKTYIKYALTCSMSVILSTGLVVGVTLGLVNHHNNYTGQGGLDIQPQLPDLNRSLIPENYFIEEDEEITVASTTVEPVPENQETITEAPEETATTKKISTDEMALASLDHTIETLDIDTTAVEEIKQEADSSLFYTVYRLKQGENASIVANEFGVTTDTILSVNGVANATRMATGAYLKVPSMSGILYEVSKNDETLETIVNKENKAKKVSLDLEQIAKINGIKATEKLSVGDTIFLAGGKLSNEQRAEISGDSYKKPLRNSYYISSPYGWRVSPFDASKRSYHNGIDLACPKGTPIYAAAAGTVITAGYSNVYGNYVIIKHVSGYKTLYGHMSVINAKNGQYVDQGTVIGKVGSTGQSTGPHLHFTMYKNDKAINPYEKVYF